MTDNNVYISAFDTEYEAIIIGSGISGGCAANELAEPGLKRRYSNADVISFTTKITSPNTSCRWIRNLRPKCLKQCGVKMSLTTNNEYSPGEDIRKMGTAGMGRDPQTSALNDLNQAYDDSNLFVTDGACIPQVPAKIRR